MTGYDEHEFIGRNCRFLQSDDRSQESIKILSDAVVNGTECTVVIRNYTKQGSLFWNELHMSPIKDSFGTVTHFIGIQYDISDRKKAEQQLRQHQDQMEKEIQERTKSLKDNEAFLTSIVQTVRESLLVLNPDF